MTARHRRERGVALLLVFWVLMLLGILALDFSRYMRDDAMAAINLADETRGYYIALAGMNRAIYDAERVRERSVAASGAAGTNPVPDIDPTIWKTSRSCRRTGNGTRVTSRAGAGASAWWTRAGGSR
jgi:Tfp pilus assembly protein PilX